MIDGALYLTTYVARQTSAVSVAFCDCEVKKCNVSI